MARFRVIDASPQLLRDCTSRAMSESRIGKVLVTFAILAAVYFAVAKLGLQFTSAHPSTAAVWPASGLALTAFLILGYRVWPAILAGTFPVNVTTAGTVATSISVSAGNTSLYQVKSRREIRSSGDGSTSFPGSG
jgi:hypothetical protein